jgi:hypothetical protein
MRICLVGGTGRSGTSFLYRQLLKVPGYHGIPEFESGIFAGVVSILDLYDYFVESYSPERYSWMASIFRTNAVNNFDRKAYKDFSGYDRSQIAEIVDAFLNRAYRERRQSKNVKATFVAAAEEFIERLFKFDKNEMVFCEKTPHNLLQFHRVIKLFPQTKCVAIFRDPRAVSESVARQSWGPKTFEDAVMWTRSVTDQFHHIEDMNLMPEGSLLKLRMEDLATDHRNFEARVAEFLGVERKAISLYANSQTLDKWTDTVSQSQLEFAYQRLSGIMKREGYLKDRLSALDYKPVRAAPRAAAHPKPHPEPSGE